MVESPSSYTRLVRERYGLIGEECDPCRAKIFPPRDVCLECGEATSQKEFVFSGKGEIYSYTTIYNAPQGFEHQVPYTVALIKLDEGPMLTAQLTDVDRDDVSIGMPVEMVTRKLKTDRAEGLILYGYKFRPQHQLPI